jgi:hypothetical protein
MGFQTNPLPVNPGSSQVDIAIPGAHKLTTGEVLYRRDYAASKQTRYESLYVSSAPTAKPTAASWSVQSPIL